MKIKTRDGRVEFEIPGKKCIYCGAGEYYALKFHSADDMRNRGFQAFIPVGGNLEWVAMECDRCHNVQMFRASQENIADPN